MKILGVLIGVTSAMVAFAGSAQAGPPSFRCYSPNSAQRSIDAEWTICRTGYLGDMDQNLATAYRQVKAQLNWRAGAKLRRTQLAWLRHRNACGDDRRCIARKYRQRTRQLVRYENCFDDSARPGCVRRKLSRHSRRWEQSRVSHLNGWRRRQPRNVSLWQRY